MPDSLPPTGGPDSYGGWDLEGLLSGENVWLPERMRPVAGTLASLRAAPMRAELADEAAARAAFRQIMLSSGSGPAWASGGADNARTLIQPAPTADDGPRVVRGPRHSHRRPPRRRLWQPKALAGAVGAAVVIIGGITLGGVFSGSGNPVQLGHGSGTSTTAKSRGGGTGSNGLDGSAKNAPLSRPTPTSSASAGQPSSSESGADSERSALCRQYWAFFAHPESSAKWAAEQGTLQQLSEMAGSPWNVPRYCGDYYQWGLAPPVPVPESGDSQGGSGPQTPGDQQDKSKPLPPAGDGNGNGNESGGSGNSGNGNGGSGGNGNSSSGNGNGNGSNGGNGNSGNGNGKTGNSSGGNQQ
jgi:hypothetical protein